MAESGAERKRGVMLTPVAIDQDTGQIGLANTHVPDPVQAALAGAVVGEGVPAGVAEHVRAGLDCQAGDRPYARSCGRIQPR
jgi:hypothetical protein